MFLFILEVSENRHLLHKSGLYNDFLFLIEDFEF